MPTRKRRACAVPDCIRIARARGYCAAHYERLMKCGDVQADKPLRANAVIHKPFARRYTLLESWKRLLRTRA